MARAEALISWLRAEWGSLTQLNRSDRRWPMPLAAALSSGLPLLVGAWFGHLDYGLISSLGGMVFLYLPETPMYHRMVVLLACAFALIASYAAGVVSQLCPPATVPALTLTAILVTMVSRYYCMPPPGSFFFVMAASVGAHTPGGILDVPLKVGLLTMGCLLASLIAFLYSLIMLRRQAPRPIPALPAPTFDFVVFDAVIIGLFVGIALALAQSGEDQLRELEAEIQDTMNKLTTLYVQHAKLAAILDLQSQLNLKMRENISREQQTEAPQAETSLPNGGEVRVRDLGVVFPLGAAESSPRQVAAAP